MAWDEPEMTIIENDFLTAQEEKNRRLERSGRCKSPRVAYA